jgi:CelD/BcsL family acetyltransferase involved in cellulose biosynthesis
MNSAPTRAGPAVLADPGALPAVRACVRWESAPVSEFERFEARWRELHATQWSSPVLAFDFIASTLRAFARGGERIVCALAGSKPVALGVLERPSRFTWSTFQPPQAPIGPWVQDPAWPLESLLPSLLRALPGPALVLGVTQQDPQCLPRPSHSPWLATLDYIRTAAVSIDRPFEDYWRARDKKVRYEMKRRLARLKEQGLEPHLEVVRDAAAVADQVAAFGDLESAGWKAATGTAVHAGNAQGAFYRDLLSRFCRHGAARIYRYTAGQRVLAMQMCIEHDGTLVFLKTTYDERLRACAPGVLMKAEIFRDLFADGGVRRIEFYGSIKEWQLKWIDETRMQYHVNVYRSALLARAHRSLRRRWDARPGADVPGATED